MKPILETTRLYLREFMLSDASCLFHLNNNPNVLKYTGDLPFKSVDEANRFIENYTDYKRNGFGRWAVCLKENNEFIGWCGLKRDGITGVVDLGFRFFENHWGKGFATEAAKVCVKYGFFKLNLNQIIGRAYIENKASINVLNKCNFKFEKTIEYDLQPAVLYMIKMIQIKKITAQETYPIRLEVLRKGISLPFEFNGDLDEDTFHLGAFKDQKLIAVSSYMKASSHYFEGNQYQLRGMATLEEFQGMGAGKLMMKQAFEILNELNINYLWCNARVQAVPFYEKIGLQKKGNPYDIKFIGLHYVMGIKLQ
jgi:RimJ/RimL family protein N-acetyltransferase/GNAT superfamily N-acetyltransferase